MQAQVLSLRPYVAPEDQARADFYALLSALWAGPPSQALLNAIAGGAPLASEEYSDLSQAWNDLMTASSVMDVDAATTEYHSLFGGVSQSVCNLHGSHHLTGFMMEKPLVAVRQSMDAMGIGRLPEAEGNLVEDHLAVLCEVMRLMISGSADIKPMGLGQQAEFFNQHVASWVFKGLSQISTHPLTNYYKVVAKFAQYFFTLEQEALSIV